MISPVRPLRLSSSSFTEGEPIRTTPRTLEFRNGLQTQQNTTRSSNIVIYSTRLKLKVEGC